MMTRRRFLRLAAAAACAAAFLPRINLVKNPAEGSLDSNTDRAFAAHQALQSYLYRPSQVPGDRSSLYLEQIPHSRIRLSAYLRTMVGTASVWPFSQAIAGTLDLLGLSPAYGRYAQDQIERGLSRYWDGTAYRSGVLLPPLPRALRFYDDNAWIGLNLVRYHRMTGDEAALARARQVFAYITTGWHEDPSHRAPGGIYWVESFHNRDRNTCSNGPSAELGLRLYQMTGQQSYLDWALKMYDWVNSTLMGPTGLYWDRLDLDGNVEMSQWSYNQGTMIGAGALLYSITRDPKYLTLAQQTADAALSQYGTDGYWDNLPAFNAIFFRSLLLLGTVDASYIAPAVLAMQQYADDAWLNNRSPANLFSFPAGQTRTRLLDQAAMVAIYACLDCDPANYDLLV